MKEPDINELPVINDYYEVRDIDRQIAELNRRRAEILVNYEDPPKPTFLTSIRVWCAAHRIIFAKGD
jgi:hypothetical protein